MLSRELIAKAVAAHGAWRQRLRTAVETGKSDFTVSVVQVDDRCDFGKWLASLDASTKNSPRVAKIRALHADFHKEAARILAAVLEKRKNEAEAALSPTSPFGKLSGAMALELNAWMQEVPE